MKRIALSGYDKNEFMAPNDVYAKLPDCCKYERKAPTPAKAPTPKAEISVQNTSSTTQAAPEPEQLKPVFDAYFVLKDALVKSNASTATTQAKNLFTAINAVKVDKLAAKQHTVWTKIMKELAAEANHINQAKNIANQRKYFMTISKNMYELIKVSNQETPRYLQHCPMANEDKGADWLSKEKNVENPYYGIQMLTCGNTVETIK